MVWLIGCCFTCVTLDAVLNPIFSALQEEASGQLRT